MILKEHQCQQKGRKGTAGKTPSSPLPAVVTSKPFMDSRSEIACKNLISSSTKRILIVFSVSIAPSTCVGCKKDHPPIQARVRDALPLFGSSGETGCTARLSIVIGTSMSS